eukprot:119761-Amphidinium_carterae.1
MISIVTWSPLKTDNDIVAQGINNAGVRPQFEFVHAAEASTPHRYQLMSVICLLLAYVQSFRVGVDSGCNVVPMASSINVVALSYTGIVKTLFGVGLTEHLEIVVVVVVCCS